MNPDVRDRFVLPLLIPLGLLALIVVVVVSLGVLFLYNPMTVAVVIAIVVAGGVLAAFGLATSRRPEELTKAKSGVIVLAGIAPLLIGALVAVGVIEPAEERVIEHEPEFGVVPEDAVEVVARGIAFQEEIIEFDQAEGEQASIYFVNEDAGIPHNVAIYPQTEGDPMAQEPIFRGEIFNGVDDMVYEFEAPPPGEYIYLCDVHPTQMIGTAVFGAPAG